MYKVDVTYLEGSLDNPWKLSGTDQGVNHAVLLQKVVPGIGVGNILRLGGLQLSCAYSAFIQEHKSHPY